MSDNRTEFEELMAGKALGELDSAELDRLEELGERLGGIDTDDLEALVGELTAALAPADEEDLPASLREKIMRAAERELPTGAKGPDLRVVSGTGPAVAPTPAPAGGGLMAWSGWAVAAAMAALWIGGLGGPSAGPEAPDAPTPAELRAELTEGGVDVVEIAWTATEDPAATGASGDLVWSNETQTGVMRFVGLEPNDPNQLRYQLWIFDGTRDERYPIDGGLFDVEAGAAEVLVPIDARLSVGQPTLFAVTVERADGVVVSDRERIVVVAPMDEASQAGQ